MGSSFALRGYGVTRQVAAADGDSVRWRRGQTERCDEWRVTSDEREEMTNAECKIREGRKLGRNGNAV